VPAQQAAYMISFGTENSALRPDNAIFWVGNLVSAET